MILIYTGTHQQAERLARALDFLPSQWRFVSDRNSLEGYERGATILRCGAFRFQSELADAMLAMGFKIFDVNTDLMLLDYERKRNDLP